MIYDLPMAYSQIQSEMIAIATLSNELSHRVKRTFANNIYTLVEAAEKFTYGKVVFQNYMDKTTLFRE